MGLFYFLCLSCLIRFIVKQLKNIKWQVIIIFSDKNCLVIFVPQCFIPCAWCCQFATSVSITVMQISHFFFVSLDNHDLKSSISVTI